MTEKIKYERLNGKLKITRTIEKVEELEKERLEKQKEQLLLRKDETTTQLDKINSDLIQVGKFLAAFH